MKKSQHLLAGLWFGVCVSITGNAFAIPVTLPPELAPDTPYRLVFVTAGLANASSNDIAVYNNYVSNQAATSTELSALGTEWRVLASTPGVDALSNTGTNPLVDTSVSIYNLAGQLVASSYADLWDGSLTNPINIDQGGNTVNQSVFTGTGINGYGIAGRQLGAVGFRVQYGNAGLTSSGWTTIDWAGTLAGLHYYGISGVLGQAAVPVPGAVWLFGSGLLGLLGTARRKRQYAC